MPRFAITGERFVANPVPLTGDERFVYGSDGAFSLPLPHPALLSVVGPVLRSLVGPP